VAANRIDPDGIDPSEEAPEADLLEQQAPVDSGLIYKDDGSKSR